METLIITATARKYPSLPYQKIKDDILGKTYAASLAFVGATRAQALNKQYRKKEYVPNVLSFPLDDNTGEIFITPTVGKNRQNSA
jgi:ssRNA-specific RNase YbeY (16S rRNA maturation enzyme)